MTSPTSSPTGDLAPSERWAAQKVVVIVTGMNTRWSVAGVEYLGSTCKIQVSEGLSANPREQASGSQVSILDQKYRNSVASFEIVVVFFK